MLGTRNAVALATLLSLKGLMERSEARVAIAGERILRAARLNQAFSTNGYVRATDGRGKAHAGKPLTRLVMVAFSCASAYAPAFPRISTGKPTRESRPKAPRSTAYHEPVRESGGRQ